MMTRFVLTLLIGLVVSFGATPSYAMVCEKYAGFKDFSERVVFNENELKSFKAKGEGKSLYYQKGSYTETEGRFQLLPNGKMIRGGYNEIARYKCDYTVDEVLAKNSAEMSSDRLCAEATLNGTWRSTTGSSAYLVALAKRRGLSCGVGSTTQTASATASKDWKSTYVSKDFTPEQIDEIISSKDWRQLVSTGLCENGYAMSGRVARAVSSNEICDLATNASGWVSSTGDRRCFYFAAKSRGLSCGVEDSESNVSLCSQATIKMFGTVRWDTSNPQSKDAVLEAKRRGLSCEVGKRSFPSQTADKGATELSYTKPFIWDLDERRKAFFKQKSAEEICKNATIIDMLKLSFGKGRPPPLIWRTNESSVDYVLEAKRRGLSCGVDEASLSTQIASAPKAEPKVTSAALTAAEKEAERLRQELAALKAKQQQQQQTISSDTKLPTITIASALSNGPQGTVKGRVRDNTGIAEVRVDGKQIQTDRDGNFTANTYVPEGGVSVSIQAIDLAGLSSSMSVRLDRSASTTTASISFERLNPLGRKVAKNKDALALIIGVDGYKSTPARAIYADSDAKVFTDYASQKLGIPTNRIKTLVNDGAGEREMLLSVKSWLSRASKQGKSDVYVFFAGHGLASDDGQKMYLLPYDGAPELLEKTAILRQELFDDIASANPRSVTVFLDTCYSGTTRGTDMLIASRPIAIKALKQSVPDNFTVMTAARGDQTAKPLEEAKHGMFSYFLMKGMEGEADKNQDNKITAGELHSYVQSNVVQQSSGSQTPELQGDAERVLVRFQ